MLRFASLVSCLITLWAAGTAARAADAVAVYPSVALPGQTVVLRWYFTGTKVIVSGGRFLKGTVVTGKSLLTDNPLKTTRYTFTVNYVAKDGRGVTRPLTAKYSAVATVDNSVVNVAAYHASHGWEICYLKNWHHDHVNTPDEGRDGLVFFQPEMDAVERVAVAVMQTGDADAEKMKLKMLSDAPSRYDDFSVVTDKTTTFEDMPACWVVFSGIDHSHPGVRTTSIVMTFVNNGRAYVVSARTATAHYAARQALLEKLVRSFILVNPSTPRPKV